MKNLNTKKAYAPSFDFDLYDDEEPVQIRTYAQAVAEGEFSRRLTWLQESERNQVKEQRKAQAIARRNARTQAKLLNQHPWLADNTAPKRRKAA